MKRVIGALAVVVLSLGLGLSGQQAAALAGPSAHSVVTPDGKVVKTSKPKGVSALKGSPQEPGDFSTLATCDGLGTSPCYLYNGASQSGISKNGLNANFTIGGHAGSLTGGDGHTLAEIAVESSDGQQIVEIGWTVDPVVNKTNGVGTTTPRPFVYRWVNGVGGCYNGCGFVFNTSSPTVPGVTNLTPGTVVNLGVWHDDNQKVWWLKWGSDWVGYFPDSIWTTATPSVSFTRMQWVQVFGEIASPYSKPCSDMGSGVTPSSSTTATASKISSVTYNNADLSADTTTVNLSTYTIPSTTAGNPYGGVYAPPPVAPATNIRSFYYGGPMWNAAKTGVGTKGAC